jgi:hypothetical protein
MMEAVMPQFTARGRVVAGLVREHAKAVRAADRPAIDFSAGAAVDRGPDLSARPIVITRSDFRFAVVEQLRERGIEADIVLLACSLS